ncbi:zinc finger protein 652 isoform X1 [Folsomia candida]|nr:zinc finger protein 652 isoform X1 [Folsomia candida]
MVSMVCFLCSQVIPTTIPSTAPLDNKEIRKIVPISLLLELLSSSSPCSPTCRSRKKIAPQFAENFESCEFCPACAPMISEMEEIRSQISILEGQMGQKVSIIQDMLVNSLSVEGQSDDKITQLRTSVLKTMRGDKTEQDGNVVLENVAVKVEADEGNLFLDENYETFDYPNSFSGMELNSEETDPLKLEGEDNDDYDESSFCIHPQPRKRRGRGRPVKPKTRRGRPPKSQSVGKEKVSPSPRGDKAAKSEENSKPPPDRKRRSNRPKKKVVPQKVKTPIRVPVKNRKFRDVLICRYCEKSFVAEYTLNYHIARHHHIPCSKSGCSAKFGSEKEKNAHIKEVHRTPKKLPVPNPDHVCHICRKKFKHNDSLRSHVRRRHDESKRPQCETCGEKFLHESTLQSHRVREHGADHLVCDECGSIFSAGITTTQNAAFGNKAAQM